MYVANATDDDAVVGSVLIAFPDTETVLDAAPDVEMVMEPECEPSAADGENIA